MWLFLYTNVSSIKQPKKEGGKVFCDKKVKHSFLFHDFFLLSFSPHSLPPAHLPIFCLSLFKFPGERRKTKSKTNFPSRLKKKRRENEKGEERERGHEKVRFLGECNSVLRGRFLKEEKIYADQSKWFGNRSDITLMVSLHETTNQVTESGLPFIAIPSTLSPPHPLPPPPVFSFCFVFSFCKSFQVLFNCGKEERERRPTRKRKK